MTEFLAQLNRDQDDILTSARWDDAAQTWLHDSAMWHQNASGIWVPVSPTNPLPTRVDNLPATQQVAGAVSVDNFPATQQVTGIVTVDNLPATQQVSGTVAANQGTPAADADAWPVKLTGSNVLLQGVVTVATPGQRVQLSADAPCREVLVVGLPTNTGYVYLGTNEVSNTVFGAKLGPGNCISVPVTNLNLLYIDADVAGDGVSYLGVA